MSLQARGNALRENRENLSQKSRQTLKAGGNNGKRNVLGNVTNQVRRQPLRAAKDKHTLVGCSKSGFGGQENEVPSKSGFAIFQDVTERVPPCGVPAEFEQQALSAGDVVHIDDELMQEKENMIEDQVIPDSIIGLHHQAAPIPRLAALPLHPLQIVEDPDVASPMAIDCFGRDLRDESRDEFGLGPYSNDIYNFLREKELELRPGADFMSRQTDVSMSMRNILVDWLVEVGEEYKLNRETLFLSINFIDRFLSLVRVERPKLQLVGAASMFIAAKYEEIYPPDVGEFVYITDDTYTKRQVLKMESVILKLLEFRVAAPTISWFCDLFLENFSDMSDTAKFLAYFFTELSLIEVEDFVGHPSSVIAASCIVLARSTLNLHPVWPQNIELISGFEVVDLLDCVKSLYCLYKRTPAMPQQAVVEKYKQEKFLRVSLIPASGVLTLL